MQTTIGENDGWKQIAVVGGETVFNTDFPFFSLDDFKVWTTSAAGVSTLLIRGTDYDVSGVPDEGEVYPNGTVTTRAPVVAGLITLARNTAILRSSNFPQTGYFDRVALNNDLNRETAALQDLRRLLGRTIHAADTDTAVAQLELPPLAGAPNSALMFDANGKPYFGVLADASALPSSAFGRSMLQAADASAAMDLLGFSAFFKTLVGAPDADAFRSLIGAAGATDPFNYVPIGVILDWAGATLPARCYWCDGTTRSRTTDSALFAAIGTTYGVGDGTTTFNLPDRRGRAPFGRDNMGGVAAGRLTNAAGGVDGVTLGASGGQQTRILSAAQMPVHIHGIDGFATSVNNNGGSVGGGAVHWADGGFRNATQYAGGDQPFSMIPPAIVCNFVIRY